jgi:DNA-binding XRE family transcriptional regulator
MRPSRKTPAPTQWSEALRSLRREHHVSQAELAKAAKIAKGTVANIESGVVRTPSYRVQRHLDWVRHHFEMRRLDREAEYANKLQAIRQAKGDSRKMVSALPVNQERVAIGA